MGVNVRADGVDFLAVGRGVRGPIEQVAGQSKIAFCGQRRSAADEGSGAPGERGDFLRLPDARRRLEIGGNVVVPTAVTAVNVAHDELRLVVDRLQIGFFRQFPRGAHFRDQAVERRPFVHQRHGSIVQGLEIGGGVAQGLRDALPAEYGDAVAA